MDRNKERDVALEVIAGMISSMKDSGNRLCPELYQIHLAMASHNKNVDKRDVFDCVEGILNDIMGVHKEPSCTKEEYDAYLKGM